MTYPENHLSPAETTVTPSVPVVLIKRHTTGLGATGTGAVYVIDCPYCGSEHIHGATVPPGNRGSHCRPGGTYDLEFPK